MVVTPLLATAGFQVAKGGESSALGAKDRRSSAAGAAGRGGAGCAEKTGWRSFSGALFGARGQPASGAACALHAVRAAPSVIWGRWGRGIEHPTKTFAPCGPPRGALARQSCVCRTRPAQNEETFWFCRARRRERARRPRRAPARARRLRQGHPHGRKKNGARPSPGARPRPPAFSLPRLHLACVECSSFLHPIGAPRRPPQRREPAFAPLQGARGANESQREGGGGRRRAAQAGGVVRALAPPAVLGYPSEVPSGGSLACLPSWAIRGASRARCGFGLRPGGRPGRWSRSVQPVNSGRGMARGGAARRGAREALNQKRVWEPRNDLAAVNQPRGAAG